MQIAVSTIYGIGKSSSEKLCRRLGVSKNLKFFELSEDQISKLLKMVEQHKLPIASSLKKLKALGTKRDLAIKSYKGSRKKHGLPARGQRTRTNGRTARKRF